MNEWMIQPPIRIIQVDVFAETDAVCKKQKVFKVKKAILLTLK